MYYSTLSILYSQYILFSFLLAFAFTDIFFFNFLLRSRISTVHGKIAGEVCREQKVASHPFGRFFHIQSFAPLILLNRVGILAKAVESI